MCLLLMPTSYLSYIYLLPQQAHSLLLLWLYSDFFSGHSSLPMPFAWCQGTLKPQSYANQTQHFYRCLHNHICAPQLSPSRQLVCSCDTGDEGSRKDSLHGWPLGSKWWILRSRSVKSRSWWRQCSVGLWDWVKWPWQCNWWKGLQQCWPMW